MAYQHDLEDWLFLGDFHFPYNDKRFFELVLKVVRHFKPHGICILGDWFDFYKLSRFSKDPYRGIDIEGEIEAGVDGLERIVRAGDFKVKKFVAGNHEDRYWRYLLENANEIIKKCPTLEQLLHLDELRFEYTPYKGTDRLGHFRMTHDIGTAGKYAVFRAADAFQTSNATAHIHRGCVVYFGTIEGDMKIAASFGWGGDKSKADYATDLQKKDWCLGMGWGKFHRPTGIMYVQCIPSINYTCVVDGIRFEAPFMKETVTKKVMSYEELVEKYERLKARKKGKK